MVKSRITFLCALGLTMALMAFSQMPSMVWTAPDRPPLGPMEGAKKPRRCIILWMHGGPSQIDTFDPKMGAVALFKPIDTNVKGLQISESLPRLAKQANHLAILRTLTHRNANHAAGACLMRTGQEATSPINHPSFACVLAKELGGEIGNLPRYVSVDVTPWNAQRGFVPGILGVEYGPVVVGRLLGVAPPMPGQPHALPPIEAFEAVSKANAGARRVAVTNAFDLSTEKAETRDSYGRGRFGSGCLLARRLIETGVPVVEVSMGGWDMHGNLVPSMTRLGGEMDAGMATLIKDLDERRLLDETLIVWMGEFGRTPNVNAAKGRDHWATCFSVVLAGGGIKGGQAIGKTSANGLTVEARPVTPPELLATIYTSFGIDPHKGYPGPNAQMIPLIERGNNAVKEALR